jgi:hypothetical protein
MMLFNLPNNMSGVLARASTIVRHGTWAWAWVGAWALTGIAHRAWARTGAWAMARR